MNRNTNHLAKFALASSAIAVYLVLGAGLVASPPAEAKRLIRGWAGKQIDNAGRSIDQKVLQPAKEGAEHVGRQVDKHVFQEIKKHPEIALAIAAAAGVGWVACMDGCTLILGAKVTGSHAAGGSALVGGVIGAINADKEQDRPSEASGTHSYQPTSPAHPRSLRGEEAKHPHKKELGGDTESRESKFFSKAEFPMGPPRDSLSLSYYNKTLDAKAENAFASPTFDSLFRVPTPADIGGIFTSPRSDLGGSSDALRARELFGHDARRMHGANDFLAKPGDLVLAPMSGKASVREWRKPDGTTFNVIVIEGKDMTVARVLYGKPSSEFQKPAPFVGYREVDVHAGVTVIATADDLSRSPEYRNTPNHVHVDVTKDGQRIDPLSPQPFRPGPWRLESNAKPQGQPGYHR